MKQRHGLAAPGATVELRSAVPGHGDNHVARRAFEVGTEDTAETTQPWHPTAYVVMHPRSTVAPEITITSTTSQSLFAETIPPLIIACTSAVTAHNAASATILLAGAIGRS